LGVRALKPPHGLLTIVNLKSLVDPSLLAASVAYGVLLRIAGAAGILGIALGVIVTFALWRYAYQVLREAAHGRAAPETVSDFNGVPVVLHFVLFTLLAILLGTTPLLRAWPAADSARWLALLAVLAAFPASAALLGITNSLTAAVNPARIWAVISTLGGRYLTLLGMWLALAIVIGVTEALLGRRSGVLALLGVIVSTWGFLALFALIGGSIRERAADFDLPGEPELKAERTAADRDRERQKALDRAYASIRSGLVAEGYATIKTLAATEHHSLEIYQWLFNQLLTWEDPTHALALGARFVERLLADGREQNALDLADQCRQLSKEFALPSATVDKLVAYARSVGRQRLADDLEARAR
jgi:hypothetical protein